MQTLLTLTLLWFPLQEGDAPKPDALKKPAGGFGLDLSVKSTLTTNLYKVSPKREDDFDSQDPVGERFHDMEGPEDLHVRSGLDASWAWKLAKKRKFGLGFYFESNWYARNAIAEHIRIGAEARYDLTRRDHFKLDMDVTPERFQKNLVNDEGGLPVYRPAEYESLAFALRYTHDWTGDLSTGLRVKHDDREYDRPFENRDRAKDTITLSLDYDLTRSIAFSFEIGFADTDPSTSLEFTLTRAPVGPRPSQNAS